ncbi:hypothetical protein MPSEU_000148600 [Mayamaea pseudoterrestris]|nr:hypothetical protein MPSEU_000148600 [Mayamaea pseudoterrestris]
MKYYYQSFNDEDPSWTRMLQNDMASGNGTAVNPQSDSEILRNTFTVYGSVFLVFMSAFCVLRQWRPKWYNLRSWIDEIKTPLAENMFGYVSWIWNLLLFSENDIIENCSLDFLCLARLLRMGFRISLVAMFNAIWLMPLYSTSPIAIDTSNVTDPIASLTIANVPSGSYRLAGTAVASYVLFGYLMYTVYYELYWYIDRRHAFLLRPEARNYTVFIRNIPPDFRSNQRLEDFFRHLYSQATVVEIDFLMRVPNLSKLVARRDVVVAKLERAILLRERTGREPMLSQRSLPRIVTPLRGSHQVSAVDAYTQELIELNRDIKERIEAIRRKQYDYQQVTEISTDETATEELSKYPVTHSSLVHVQQPATETDRLLRYGEDDVHARAESLLKGRVTSGSNMNLSLASMSEHDAPAGQPPATPPQRKRQTGNFVTTTAKIAAKAGVFTANAVASTATHAVSTVATTAASAAAQAASILQNHEGEYNDAAFVVVNRLSAVHSTLQMLQHDKPFTMEVIEAPEPEDVFWLNTGRSHKDLQLGWLLSMVATGTLCIFWTVPIAFVASLNSVTALTKVLPFVSSLIKAIPILAPILTILAPLLVVLLNSLLPTILGLISMLEGPISGATLTASKFSKLAVFSIVQTFFISAITKGAVSVASQIAGQVQEILANPLLLVDLLATELARNSSYFIQIIFVSTVMSSGLELTRLVPLIFAAVRRFCGPRVTPRERKRPFIGLFFPLRHISAFPQADFMSSVVLLYMVLFVYAAIAPLVSFIAAFCFLWLQVAFTNQNIFIYAPTPDSGGKLWPKAIKILLSCMLIAEIITLGILGLRQSIIAVPLMVPLIVVSALFYGYVNQQHFKVAEHLTADACMEAEMKHIGNCDIYSIAEDEYTQPALKRKVVLPELPDPNLMPDSLRDIEDGGVDGQSESQALTSPPTTSEERNE